MNRTIKTLPFAVVVIVLSTTVSIDAESSHFQSDTLHFQRVLHELGTKIQTKLTKYQPPRPVLGEFEESSAFESRMQNWREISDSLVLMCYAGLTASTLSSIPLELPAYSMVGKRFVIEWRLQAPDCAFRVIPYKTSSTWPEESSIVALYEDSDLGPSTWLFPGGFLLAALSIALPENDTLFSSEAPIRIHCVVPVDEARTWRKRCGYPAPGFEDSLQGNKPAMGEWHLNPSKLEGPEAEEFMRSYREGKAGWEETKRMWKPGGSRVIPNTVTMDLEYEIRPYRIVSGFFPEIWILAARIRIRDSVVMTITQ